MAGFVQFSKDLFAISGELGRLASKLAIHGQSYLIYPGAFPDQDPNTPPPVVATPAEMAMEYELVDLPTSDGVKVKAYLMMQKQHLKDANVVKSDPLWSDQDFAKSRATVIMFHGNGADFGQLVPLGRVFYLSMRCNVLIVSYRGYGGCEGTPSEKGIKCDSQAALNYSLKHPVLGGTNICVYGQSIGGAVAIDLASRNPTTIKAVVVENTFLSLTRLVPVIMPIFAKLTIFLRQKWDSEQAIKLIPATTPMLFLSGGQDEVVPQAQMKELYQISCEKSEPPHTRMWKEYKAGTHNDTFIQPGYWRDVSVFVASVL